MTPFADMLRKQLCFKVNPEKPQAVWPRAATAQPGPCLDSALILNFLNTLYTLYVAFPCTSPCISLLVKNSEYHCVDCRFPNGFLQRFWSLYNNSFWSIDVSNKLVSYENEMDVCTFVPLKLKHLFVFLPSMWAVKPCWLIILILSFLCLALPAFYGVCSPPRIECLSPEQDWLYGWCQFSPQLYHMLCLNWP